MSDIIFDRSKPQTFSTRIYVKNTPKSLAEIHSRSENGKGEVGKGEVETVEKGGGKWGRYVLLRIRESLSAACTTGMNP